MAVGEKEAKEGRSLLTCRICGSDSIEVKGKYGAALHTVCHECGADSWEWVQKQIKERKAPRDKRKKEVEVYRKRG